MSKGQARRGKVKPTEKGSSTAETEVPLSFKHTHRRAWTPHFPLGWYSHWESHRPNPGLHACCCGHRSKLPVSYTATASSAVQSDKILTQYINSRTKKKKKRDLFLLAHARRRIKRHGGRKDSPPQPWHGLQKWSQNRTAGKSSRATFPWRCDRNVPSRKCPPFPLSFLFLHFPPQIYHSSVV